ncbi:MAG TPA: hypothetical protein VM599_04690 [Thermoanaerobaculia bacterium]|nr:hypothetical protein [Thermoanaerobaculia bacterium]
MISRNRLTLAAAALAALAAFSAPAPAAADVDFGVRGGVYTDLEEAFLGVELLMPVTGQWFFNPNLEYVFVDPGSLWTLNGDFHYDFAQSGNLTFWAGGGLAVIFRDFDDRRGRRDDSETDVGANLLAGLGLVRGAVRPYGQVKVILSDDTEAVLAVGVRF